MHVSYLMFTIKYSNFTEHVFLQVCQHPNSRMREWGAEALTSLIKAGLTFNHEPPLSQNQVKRALGHHSQVEFHVSIISWYPSIDLLFYQCHLMML